MRILLKDIAHARSGDKGNHCNIGVIASNADNFKILQQHLTSEKVKAHFKEFCLGSVERFELPNIYALNFLLQESLAGGGTTSLRSDSQGKTFAAALLRLEIEV